MPGFCFEDAMQAASSTHRGWLVVHGVVLGNGGKVLGVRYMHAWVERGDEVYDASTGKTFPRGLYYAVASIDPEMTRRYTFREACEQLQITQTWGPWDSVFDGHP